MTLLAARKAERLFQMSRVSWPLLLRTFNITYNYFYNATF